MVVIPHGFTYLGFPLFLEKRSVDWFKHLIQKLDNKIQEWSKSHISLARRYILIQSSSNILAKYSTSCYTILKKILKDINLTHARFWWGKTGNQFCRLLGWKDLCMPKSHGGCGIRNLSNMNLAFLMKLAWRIVFEPLSLISRIITPKYGRCSSWWKSKPKPTATSKLASGICASLKVLNKNCLQKIGNGSSVYLGTNPWVPFALDLIPRLNLRCQLLSSLHVFNLLQKHQNVWNKNKN